MAEKSTVASGQWAVDRGRERAVEEKRHALRLALGRGRHLLLHNQMSEKGAHSL